MTVDPGLCKSCHSGRRIDSAKGSVFWRCRQHDVDRSWPKYPPLPVRQCPRYEAAS